MSDIQNSDFQKIMESNLERAISFVKFAEAKNAALLTFSSAWLAAIIDFYRKAQLTRMEEIFSITTAILFMFSAILALYSFLPLNKEAFRFKPSRANQFPNLLYFGDISNLDGKEPSKTFLEKYHKGSKDSDTNFINDLCNQTIINSSIAKRKFAIFSYGASITIAAFGVMVVGFIIALI